MSSVLMFLPSLRTTWPMSLPSLPRIGDDARDGAGGGHGRAAEVDLRLGIAHAALEVAVRGGERHLVVAQGALVDPEAGAAAGVHDDGACLHENMEIARIQG